MTNKDKKPIEQLWKMVEPLGLTRQKFEELLDSGGTMAVLTACLPPYPEADTFFVKDTTPFVLHDAALETRLEDLMDFITPNRHFFVCNEVATPQIDPATYKLSVTGDAIEQPLTLTYDDILSLRSHTVVVYLECAGNHRRLFEESLGQKSSHYPQWTTGGIGTAEWTGIPLKEVLQRAGVSSTALEVNIKGLDKAAPEGGVNRSISLEKALDSDTILAYAMNGELLPPDHGFPLRAVVPGWVGTNSIKWVGEIIVSSEKNWINRNTDFYVLEGPDWPEEQYAPAKGAPIDEQNIRSSLLLPWPATLSAGRQVIRGFARSPHAKIAKVEWSADGGRSWQMASLIPPISRHAWVHFEFDWDAPSGEYELMTRATDEAGNTQPESIPFNEGGYMFNMIYRHPIIVS